MVEITVYFYFKQLSYCFTSATHCVFSSFNFIWGLVFGVTVRDYIQHIEDHENAKDALIHASRCRNLTVIECEVRYSQNCNWAKE